MLATAGGAVFFDKERKAIAVWVAPDEILVTRPDTVHADAEETRAAGLAARCGEGKQEALQGGGELPGSGSRRQAEEAWEFAVWRVKVSLYYEAFSVTHLVHIHW